MQQPTRVSACAQVVGTPPPLLDEALLDEALLDEALLDEALLAWLELALLDEELLDATTVELLALVLVALLAPSSPPAPDPPPVPLLTGVPSTDGPQATPRMHETKKTDANHEGSFMKDLDRDRDADEVRAHDAKAAYSRC